MNLLKKFIGARAEAWTGAGQKNKEPEQVKKYLKFFLKTGRLGNSGYTLKRLFIVQHLKANSGPLWCGSWSLVPQEIKKEEEQDPDPHQYNAYQQNQILALKLYRTILQGVRGSGEGRGRGGEGGGRGGGGRFGAPIRTKYRYRIQTRN